MVRACGRRVRFIWGAIGLRRALAVFIGCAAVFSLGLAVHSSGGAGGTNVSPPADVGRINTSTLGAVPVVGQAEPLPAAPESGLANGAAVEPVRSLGPAPIAVVMARLGSAFRTSCPPADPVKVTADRVAFVTDHPDYARVVPSVCYLNLTVAAEDGYVAAQQPVSTAPIGAGCPVTQPVKATADGKAYSTDHPDYAAAVPATCYVTIAAAADGGYSAAPSPPPPAPRAASPTPRPAR